MRLGDFDALTFDCYGTLIDWETGIEQAFRPWLESRSGGPGRGGSASRDEILSAFGRHESRQQEAAPGQLYPDLLAEVHAAMARDLGVEPDPEAARAFGQSVPDWPAFPDSPGALRDLQRHFKLVVLSNVDRASFAKSAARLGVVFDAVYTAQDIGSYKPDPRNFQYMIDQLAGLGIARERILHTAESLHHDHVQAKRFGLATCWIRRRAGQGATASGRGGVAVETDFAFDTLRDMADARNAEAASG